MSSNTDEVSCARQRVAIVASRLSFGGGAVVGVETIRAAASLISEGRLAVVHPCDDRYAEFASLCSNRLACPSMGHSSQFLWNRTRLRLFLARFKPDWVWSIGNYAVPGPWRQSVFVHDPHLIYPQEKRVHGTLSERIKKSLGRVELRRSLGRVVSVYAQTSAIARRLERYYGLADGSVRMFRPGVAVGQVARSDLEGVLTAEVMERVRRANYVLFYPARGYSHKNHEVIIASIRQFARDYVGTLLITTVGRGDSEAGDKALALTSEPSLRDIWMNIGPQNSEQIEALYSLSDALIMPTRLETYGLPFIEAMQHGLPVIAPKRDFIEAVCGAAAYYMPAEPSPKDIRDAVVFLRSNPGAVADLKDRGKRLVRSLPTWRESVKAVLKAERIDLASNDTE